MRIKLIPNRIRKLIRRNKKSLLEIKGYKKVSNCKKILLIEVINKNRIWLLEKEMKN
uniref:Cytochrome b6-f complex subunit PetP n=1 Tax=Polysiphonia sertularioides TaxID=945028 RepID=A0A1Z1M9R2_9FLOR|nr:cytochrome b6-f complex subunit PetP [Polysiphonia sertularioides]ARW62515.1 cytochrome b6-f complex subunit PetP [Polysiphonia sertularioides]